jgi:hypothetical protein
VVFRVPLPCPHPDNPTALLRGHEAADGNVLDDAHVGEGQQTSTDCSLEARSADEDAAATEGEPAMVGAAGVKPAVALCRPLSDKLSGEAGEEPVQRLQPSRQQRMGVTTLRHSSARFRASRQRIAFENGDTCIVICEDARGRQAGHSGADHDRMLARVLSLVLLTVHDGFLPMGLLT